MVGFMGMNMANNAGTNMINAVTSTESEKEEEEREMPEPGTLFTKEEKVEVPEVKEEPVKEEEPIVVEQAPQTYPKFCTECGNPTTGGNFCGQCGTKLR